MLIGNQRGDSLNAAVPLNYKFLQKAGELTEAKTARKYSCKMSAQKALPSGGFFLFCRQADYCLVKFKSLSKFIPGVWIETPGKELIFKYRCRI